MIDPALAACAPYVAPATLAAIIRVESAGQPLAINVNKGPRIPTPRTVAEASQIARVWIGRGHSVDLGLMQINSRNLARLGYTVEQMFEPCTNVRAGAAILSANYSAAARIHGEGQRALLDALSAYNTGSFARGYANGYVSRYFSAGRANIRIGGVAGNYMPPALDPFTADTSVFSRKEHVNDGTGPAADPAAQPASLD